jgi:hypothetical protein
MLTKPERQAVVIRSAVRLVVVLLSYCLIAYLVNAAGMDLTRILIGGGDTYSQGLPTKLFSTSFSAWNPAVQLGVYAFAEYAPFYFPTFLPLLVFPNVFGYNLFTLSHYAMAAFFFYLYARNLRLGDYAAYVGGVLFMCSGFLLAHKGHHALLGAAVWLPLMLLFIDRYFRSRLIREAAFAGASLGVSLLAGFPQTTLYMAVLAVAYFSFRSFADESRRRRSGSVWFWAAGLTAIIVVAVLIASLQLFAIAELLPTITREKISLEMFNQDSLPLPYLGTLAIPGLLGGVSGMRGYLQAGSFVSFYPYMGQLALLLTAFGVVTLWNKDHSIRFWVFVGSIAGVLCLGLPPIQYVLHFVPVYNLFRAPARHIYELDFAICVLAVYGLHALSSIALERRQIARALRLGTLVIGIFLLAAVCASQYIRFLAEHVADNGHSSAAALFGIGLQWFTSMAPRIYPHLALWRPTVLFPMIFFAASAWLLWKMSRSSRTLWKALVPVLMVADIWLPYHTLYANPDTTPLFHPKSDTDVTYLNSLDRTHYRIYPIDPPTQYVYPMMNQVHDLPAINDYSPYWDKRYQSIGQFGLNGASDSAYMSPNLMDELGVRYLIVNLPIYTDQLRYIRQFTDSPSTPLPIPDENCAALNCADASFPNPGVISLERKSAGVGIIQIPVAFTPNTLYQIKFDVRAKAPDTDPLIVDLFAHAKPWGDSGIALRRYVVSLGPDFTSTGVSIDSREMPAQNGYIRLFTLSRNPIEIRSLHIGIAQIVPIAYREVYRGPNGDVVFENPGALPRFRFAREVLPVPDIGHARAITLSAYFDPASLATVEGPGRRRMMEDGKVLSEAIANDTMRWNVTTGAHSLFVVADTWFPGWEARVDGHAVPIRIVDGFLRGVFINGAGQHRVEMSFHPWASKYGALATLAGVALLVGLCLLQRGGQREREFEAEIPAGGRNVAVRE